MDKIILQITSGRGPAECCLLVARIFQIMMKEAENKKLKVLLLHSEKGQERGTFHSATFQMEGNNVKQFTKEWLGSILWIAQSPYRKYHKRKNWYVAVNELKPQEVKTGISDVDITYQATRSSGPGGQHVNKVSTAIRATHHPSGLSVMASDSRSQLQNKKLAKERLINLLNLELLQKKKTNEKKDWMNHSSLQRGNPVKIFEGVDFRVRKLN